MIIFHPPKSDPREYKIGKTLFTVNAHYCGFENIYDRLTYLMQSELEEENIDSEISGNPVDFEQD